MTSLATFSPPGARLVFEAPQALRRRERELGADGSLVQAWPDHARTIASGMALVYSVVMG